MTGEQLEREQEQTDHVVMLSELQTLLTQQKRARETLEQQLEEEKTERKKLTTALQVTWYLVGGVCRLHSYPL